MSPLLVVWLVFAMVGCASTPADRWFQERSALTTATSLISQAHEAGVISDADLVEKVDPSIKAARRYLDLAFDRLPDGGDEFESFMDALDAVLATLGEFSKKGGG